MAQRILGVLSCLVFLSFFGPSAQSELTATAGMQELMPLLPEATLPVGWAQDGKPNWYDKENLFEHNNGDAERFIAYGFRQALVARFAAPQDATSAITVCMYDMGNRENAFGLYSTFRSPDNNFISAGAQGFLASQSVVFWQKQYVVTLEATHPSLQGNVCQMAFEAASRLGADAERLPEILKSMVAEPQGFVYRGHSLKLAANNLFGLDFLDWAYTALYRQEEREVTFFILDKQTPKSARAQYGQALTFFKRNAGEPQKVKLGDTSFVAKEKDGEKIWFVRSKQFVFGLKGFSDQDQVRSILEATVAKINHQETPTEKKGD